MAKEWELELVGRRRDRHQQVRVAEADRVGTRRGHRRGRGLSRRPGSRRGKVMERSERRRSHRATLVTRVAEVTTMMTTTISETTKEKMRARKVALIGENEVLQRG